MKQQTESAHVTTVQTGTWLTDFSSAYFLHQKTSLRGLIPTYMDLATSDIILGCTPLKEETITQVWNFLPLAPIGHVSCSYTIGCLCSLVEKQAPARAVTTCPKK